MTESVEDLARRFADFARDHGAGAPLYGQLATYAAAHPEVSAMLLQAPPTQRLPVLMFAAVHDLLLVGAGPELARFYPNLTDPPASGDVGPVFGRFLAEHGEQVAATLATRHTQTNEIGRCAVLLPALATVADEVGEIAMLDVGASAGLTLLLDRYAYRYSPGGDVGGVGGLGDEGGVPLLLCGTRGAVPVPRRRPRLSARLGLDAQPVDLQDPAQARWLAACLWPDQPERFARLRGALELARAQPVEVRAGDAVTDLASCVDLIAVAGHPVVTTTWVLNYLSTERQRAFVAELDRLGAGRDLTWLSLESPVLTPGLGFLERADEDGSVLHQVSWRSGRRQTERLAVCHPHGAWMHWGA
ncbi:MAG: DUF2332 domain-containing protein [Candidatus Phosphoribacter sp.]